MSGFFLLHNNLHNIHQVRDKISPIVLRLFPKSCLRVSISYLLSYLVMATTRNILPKNLFLKTNQIKISRGGVKGIVRFTDIFDDKIQDIMLTYDQPIKAGSE